MTHPAKSLRFLRVALFIVVILLAGTAILLRYMHRQPAAPFTGNSYIDLCFPLQRPFPINASELMQTYRQRWGHPLRCRVLSAGEKDAGSSRDYLLSDGTSSLILKVYDERLPATMVNALVMLGGNLTARQQQALYGSHGYLVLTRVIGAPRATMRATFALQVALSLLQHQELLGCLNVYAQLYLPNDSLSCWSKSTHLTSQDLFSLLTSISISTGSGLFTTHGMAQFAQPDIEIGVKNRNMISYYQGVLVVIASQCVENQQGLTVGTLLHPVNENLAYRVMRASHEERQLFGAYGVVILQQQ